MPRTATVRTTTPCRFLRIDGEAFLAALAESAPSAALMSRASARLARTHPSAGPVVVPAQGPPADTTPADPLPDTTRAV